MKKILTKIGKILFWMAGFSGILFCVACYGTVTTTSTSTTISGGSTISGHK